MECKIIFNSGKDAKFGSSHHLQKSFKTLKHNSEFVLVLMS